MKKEQITHNWLFWKDGDSENKRLINLPHDAMIEEKRDPNLNNGTATAYYPGGKYYYSKSIYGQEKYRNKKMLVEFEGIYMNATVYMNGIKVGGHLYGYTNFFVDITEQMIVGTYNELLVEVDNSKTPNSRWYSGSGIYRPVQLWSGEKNYIDPEGIKVRTTSIEPTRIEISICAKIQDQMYIECTIIDKGKNIQKFTLPYKDITRGNTISIDMENAKLWDDENPNLYQIRAEIKDGDKIIDAAEETFGVRMLTWNSQNGFMINGKTTKLRGGCIHHDNGLLGACTYETAELRRVRKLKEMGYNAIRYSHNPAGKTFLDICDREGMYVLDESFDQWKAPQTEHDYAVYFDSEWKKDVDALVSKDYNHPSVIMYCIGNEITDTGLPHGAMIAKMLNDEFHHLDNTRPTTIAINSMLSVLAAKQAERKKKEEEKTSEEKAVGSAEVNDIVALLPQIMASITPESLEKLIGECVKNVDIVGYNYGQNLYEGTHELIKNRVILSSETFPARMYTNWKTVMDHSYVIGDFMWTAWDYLGETGVGLPTYGTKKAGFSKPYPCLTAACGSFDLTGYPESQAYYAAIIWGKYKKPYIGVRPLTHSGEDCTFGNWRLTDSIPCWTWPGQEGKSAEIEVFSIGDEIELVQDGTIITRKKLEEYKANFNIIYHPGKLEVISYDENNHIIASTEITTASDVNILNIQLENNSVTADGEDIAYVRISIEDENHILKMNKDELIKVSVEGEGELLALGSGNSVTEELFSNTQYTSWHGSVLAIIKSTKKAGEICITASAEGMETVSKKIESIVNNSSKIC